MKIKKYWVYVIGVIMLIPVILGINYQVSSQSENITLSESRELLISFNGKQYGNVIAVTVLNRSPDTNFIENSEFQKYFYEDLNRLVDKEKGLYEVRATYWVHATNYAIIMLLYDSRLSSDQLGNLTEYVIETLSKKWYIDKVKISDDTKGLVGY
ncbi:MAG: hypothetical protein HYU56_03675 [Candidatus Aenigmarchaeota archaeon]|nr:hypothetical protein [Candidatus Aenigmarchaeota archaeon]